MSRANANANGRPPLLTIQNLGAGYGEMPVLHGIALEIFPAEMVALVGSNGAGKTTLLRALSRMLPSTGSILLNGRELNGLTSDQVFGRVFLFRRCGAV